MSRERIKDWRKSGVPLVEGVFQRMQKFKGQEKTIQSLASRT
jgi:hypothetical protein